MTTLASLGARFVGAGGPDAFHSNGEPEPLRTGVGIAMSCPCGGLSSCIGDLYIPCINPIDGGPFLDLSGHQRTGQTLEELSLSNKIIRIGGCGWRGWIESGSVVTEG